MNDYMEWSHASLDYVRWCSSRKRAVAGSPSSQPAVSSELYVVQDDPQGNPHSVDDMFSADPYANRFLYTRREFLKEANLYDYRNRMYSAELGRFLQTDPIQFDAGDVNLYRYVSNNPSNKIDPTGLISYAPGTCIEVSRCKGICKYRCLCPPGYSMGFTSSYTTQPCSFTKLTRRCFRLDSWDYAILGAALLLSELDSPAPGPADAGATAIQGARVL
jgi:RHS repeat-associated protein